MRVRAVIKVLGGRMADAPRLKYFEQFGDAHFIDVGDVDGRRLAQTLPPHAHSPEKWPPHRPSQAEVTHLPPRNASRLTRRGHTVGIEQQRWRPRNSPGRHESAKREESACQHPLLRREGSVEIIDPSQQRDSEESDRDEDKQVPGRLFPGGPLDEAFLGPLPESHTRSGISTYCTPGSPGSRTSVGLAGSANLKCAVSPVIWPATSSR